MSQILKQPRNSTERASFRVDLQGLRALAVLLVMCYHIWFSKVSGGVDIFLMLSAFFLTSSTARRIARGQRPPLVDGWLHRFSRLIPQAAVVIIGVVIAAWIILPSTRWLELIDQSSASLFYWQNWYLATHQVDYYAFNTASASPLQHFWSLSVQGQIFILWPLVLAGSALIWKKFFSRHNFAWVAGSAFGAIFIGSLAFSIYITATNQQVAYFHTGARLWEFALGSLFALALPWLSNLPEKIRRIGGWAGLVTVIGSGAVLDVQGQFPGFMALVPTVAAALVIAAPAPRSWTNPSGLLSLPPLVKLGDLSYGMYLWHWPLLVFYLEVSGKQKASFLAGTVLILVSIAASWCATKFIEKPAIAWQASASFSRLIPQSGFKLIAQFAVVAVGLGVASLPVMAWENNVEHRRAMAAAQTATDNPGANATEGWDPSPASLVLPLATELDSEWQTPGEVCEGATAPDDERISFCEQGGTFDGGAPDLVLLGDSHMQHWSAAASAMIEEAGGSWILVYEPGCRYGSDADRAKEGCSDFQDAAQDYVAGLAPEMVLTTASKTVARPDAMLRSPGEQEILVDNYEAMIQPLLDAGSRVIAMRDTPRYSYSIPECVDSNKDNFANCDGSVGYALNSVNPVEKFLDSRDYGDQVVSLDMTGLLCPEGVCKAVIGNVLTYLDDSHLSKTFVLSAKNQFASSFKEATNWE
ncbi:acyltransferase family protein [Glutamicibacter arilaitensis]|uniref:Acyltransferase n=1 Tax=Glutamicibacter arilaitensis TaxID=256701 RepID=A0A4Y8TWT7_9MICC|nr:acyltransferase family protein [Glutamicibacter arilaitensis]TFH56635.1 acyltransferase [Glutamicibacter arilaitensis]